MQNSLKQTKIFEDTITNSSPRSSPRNSKDFNKNHKVNSGFEIYVTSFTKQDTTNNLMFQDQHGMTIEAVGANKDKEQFKDIKPNAAGVDRNLMQNHGFNQKTYKQFPVKIRYIDKSPKK